MTALAKDANHEAWLLRMDPKLKQVKCYDCQHWQSFYGHGKATGLCNAGVKPGGVVHWHDTLKICSEFKPKHEAAP